MTTRVGVVNVSLEKFRRNVAGPSLAGSEDNETVSNAAIVVGHESLTPPGCRLGNMKKTTAAGHRWSTAGGRLSGVNDANKMTLDLRELKSAGKLFPTIPPEERRTWLKMEFPLMINRQRANPLT